MRKKLYLILTCLFFVTLCYCNTLFGQSANVHIGKTASASTIDGVADALWNDAPRYLAVDPHSWCYDGWVAGWFGREVSMQSEDDFSMNWRAVWDDTNPYFLFELPD